LTEAREILRKLVGDMSDWTALDSYIVAYVATPQLRRTAIASAFAASLELVREKVVELRQDTPFSTLYMRDVTRPGAEQ
jgi:segregation and condensation protein A